jgi:uncharacterized protein (DUF305 family)
MKTSVRSTAISFALACAFLVPTTVHSEESGANKEYVASMDRMNADMKKGMDTDPTTAWAKMMAAHHQGAIEMDETVLKETKDPFIREMAEKGIKDQTKEKKMLEEWTSKHGG